MDITMCKGTECPVKERCHRFTAKPDEYQAYFVDAPGETKDGKFNCNMYWGANAESIWNQLNNIVKGEEK